MNDFIKLNKDEILSVSGGGCLCLVKHSDEVKEVHKFRSYSDANSFGELADEKGIFEDLKKNSYHNYTVMTLIPANYTFVPYKKIRQAIMNTLQI